MINHSWIARTSQLTTPPSSSHILCIQEYFSLSGVYFQSSAVWCSLFASIFTHANSGERRCAYRSRLGSSSPQSPPWRGSGLLGRRCAPTLTLLFSPLQSVLPPPGCVRLCASLSHHLPPTVFGLADWAASFTLPRQQQGRLLPGCQRDKGKTWAAWSLTVFLLIY